MLYVRDDASAPLEVAEGVHALSNARLDDPWPKAVRAQHDLELALREPSPFEPLFEALASRAIAPDAELPSTGVPLELERALSAAFIVGPTYGTRSTTVVVIGLDGAVELEERAFGPNGAPANRVRRSLG